MKKKITPEKFLETELSMGITPDNPNFVRLADATAVQLLKSMAKADIDPMTSTIVDFGAGVGVYSDALRRKNLNVKALDIWKSHRDFMTKRFPGLEVISKPIKADVMVFIETAEHMTDEQITSAISEIKPELILFSSTSEKTENDEEWGHINVKSQEEWVEFWDLLDYIKVEDVTKPTAWSVVLRKI